MVGLEAEEGADAPEQALGLQPRGRRRGLGFLHHLAQAARARREHARHRLGDLRPRAQDLLEARLVEPVALGIGLRDHGGAARLAGHHAHLAEHVARRERGHPAPRRACRVDPDLGLALEQDVEPVRDRALARDDVPGAERGVHEVHCQRAQLVGGKAAEQVDAAQRRDASPDVALAPRDLALLGLLHLVVHLLWQRGRDAVALERGEQVHAHGAVGAVVAPGIGEPVAQRVAALAERELHQRAVRARLARHVLDLGAGERLLGRRDHPRRRHVEVDVEPDPAAPAHLLPVGVADDAEARADERAVGDDHEVAVARAHRGMPPADVGHPAREVVELDPVPDRDRLVDLEEQAAERVAERVLHGEGEHRGDHRRGGDQAREVHAGEPQLDRAPGEGAEHQRDVLGDARGPRARRRQREAEEHERGEPDRRQPCEQGRYASRDLHGAPGERAGAERRGGAQHEREQRVAQRLAVGAPVGGEIRHRLPAPHLPLPASARSSASTRVSRILTRAWYLSFAPTSVQGACAVLVRSIMSAAALW